MREELGEQFLHQKDQQLHTSQPIEHEVERKRMAGEETSQKPVEKISDWLKVLERTHLGHRDEPAVMERIKDSYHKNYVIKPEDIPESYFGNQKRLAREQGHGDIEITEEMRNQLSEVVVCDQKSTLDKWLDYFTSPDSDGYPMWAKYWAFNQMAKLSSYDKEKHAFAKRGKDTVAPFPDLNREALAYVVDAVIKKVGKENLPSEINNPEFEKLLAGANFGKLYAWAIEKVTPTEENELINTKGEWVKYDRNSDHIPLVESLQGHGTGWCVAGESTAESYLKMGDFYIFYSKDKNGHPVIPRAAIQMNENKIGQVRGVAPDQNLDPYIGDVVKKKLAEFPDGQAYEKKSADMKLLTEIDHKTKSGDKLSKDELIFLYEIDQPIEGFGYQRDPRIAELRSQRESEVDMPIVFECAKEKIARNQAEVNKDTKAYVGPLFPGIFQVLPEGIEHIYTSFPEGRIRQDAVDIGGTTKEELFRQLEGRGIHISNYARDMLNSPDFTTGKKSESADLVRLTVNDLGFPKGATTNEIYRKAEELGLELCPAEVGPQYRLKYTNQPMNEWLRIGMKQITDRGGDPHVFDLARRARGSWLGDDWADPGREWSTRKRGR